MSYRCGVCNEQVPHGRKLVKYIIYRDVPRKISTDDIILNICTTRKEVAREIPTCPVCSSLLEAEIPFKNIVNQRGVKRDVVTIDQLKVKPRVSIGKEVRSN